MPPSVNRDCSNRHPGTLPSGSLLSAPVSRTWTLQRKKAVELQQKWGNQACTHPAFSREYDAGERTGNYCCTQCGASLTFREKAEITAARKVADG
jgi:hypothetical protein